MKVLAGIVGLICGALVGLGLGVFAAAVMTLWSQFMSPKDPSAGAVAIVVIGTAPFGAVTGAVLGVRAIQKRPRLFCATIVPLAIVLVEMLFLFAV